MAFSWLRKLLTKSRPHTAERQASDPEDPQANHYQRNALGFFDLPQELRDQIYSHIFDDDKRDHPTHYQINCSTFILITERPGEACSPWDVYNMTFRHPFMPEEWTWASKRLMKEAAKEFARSRVFKVSAPYPTSLFTSRKFYHRKFYLLHCIPILVNACRSIKTTPAQNRYTYAGTKIALKTPDDDALRSFMALRHPDSRPLCLHMPSDLRLNMHIPGDRINLKSAALASMIGKLSRVEISFRLVGRWGPSGSVGRVECSAEARKEIYKELELRVSRFMGSNNAGIFTCGYGNEGFSMCGSNVNFRRTLTIEWIDG